jgi:hypothetical protein
MSSYFGALIRSSGMRIGSADAPSEVRSPASDGIVEINEERYASSPERSSTAPASQEAAPQATAPAMKAAADGNVAAQPPSLPPVRPAIAPAASSAPAVAAAPTSRTQVNSRDPVPAPAERRSTVAPEPASSSVDPVRLALQWIAADPEARGPSAVASRSVVPVSPSLGHASAEVSTPRVAAREIGVPVVHEVRQAAPVRQPSARTIAPPPVQSVVEPPSAPVPRSGRGNDRGDAAEETLEISIGTINLHVEAPAPRTVVQPAPAPAAARPRTERSGLHRRYLRSF